MKFAIIHGVTIYNKDIVKIKFKKLEEILLNITKEGNLSIRDVMSHYDLGGHLQALISGGSFRVYDVRGDQDHKRLSENNRKQKSSTKQVVIADLHEIIIEDHLKNGDNWYINEDMIESIEVIQAEESYFSELHALSLMKIDGALYINGELLTKHDKKILHMFEQCLSDNIIKSLLDVDFNNEECED